MMNHFSHIPYSRLVDLAEGRLLPDERAQLEAHIDHCTRCSAELAQLGRQIELMRTDTAEDPPQPVIDRVLRLFRARKKTPAADARRLVLSVLQFNRTGSTPAYGVRSGQPEGQLYFVSSEDYDIDLRIEPGEEGWIVSGQVLGGSTADGWTELLGASTPRHSALNDQSEFHLPAVSAGQYRLIFHLPEVDIELHELKIGP
jgi:anti-sigma factor RsiW